MKPADICAPLLPDAERPAPQPPPQGDVCIGLAEHKVQPGEVAVLEVVDAGAATYARATLDVAKVTTYVDAETTRGLPFMRRCMREKVAVQLVEQASQARATPVCQ